MRVLFIQAFGMQAQAGGGTTKIFRSLLEEHPAEVGVLVYGVRPPQVGGRQEEWFIRERISLGRLERSRLAGACMLTRPLTWKSSRKAVFESMSRWRPDHVHMHVQGLGFIHAAAWCRANKVAFSVSIHDDIRHLASNDPWKGFIETEASKVWREAANCFVISPEIGREYGKRYGERRWIQITDGLRDEAIARQPREGVPRRLSIYFAGAVNVPYEPNFRALQHALKLYQKQHPGDAVRMVLRGGRHFEWEDSSAPKIEVRPFGTPQEVAADLQDADILYLPLSIDARYSNFAKFSLSTKMVAYLGAGLPIFYHGPRESAAVRLLRDAGACVGCSSNDVADLLAVLDKCIKQRDVTTLNALRLANERFRLEPIRERFWGTIMQQ